MRRFARRRGGSVQRPGIRYPIPLPAGLPTNPAEVADQEEQGNEQAEGLGHQGGEPDAVGTEEKGERHQTAGDQHQAPAKGDGQGGDGVLHGGEEAGDHHIEAHKEEGEGVQPQSGHRGGEQGAVRLEEQAHHRPGQHLAQDKEAGGEAGGQADAVGEELVAHRPLLRPQVVAAQGLDAVGDADHTVKHQGIHIADDGIGHQGAGADDTLYDVVEQEDDHAVGELAEAVGGTQGDNAA